VDTEIGAAFVDDGSPFVDAPSHVVAPTTFDARIGVYDREREKTQRIRVGGSFDVPVSTEVFHAVAREAIGAGHVVLCETLADHIARGVLARSGANVARVRVEKPDVFPDVVVGVEVERRRIDSGTPRGEVFEVSVG